jgi:DNA-directed RNA polymerase subunit RPC12/RpoP
MEHEQFETESNAFKCVECSRRIKVEVAEARPRPIGCPECGIEYTVTKNKKGGLSVTVHTESAPELITENEEDLEEEYLEEQEEEEE